MRIITKKIAKIKNALHVVKLLYSSLNKLFVVNYVPSEYYLKPTESFKTAFVAMETKDIECIINGVINLELTTSGKLYSIKSDVSHQHGLQVFDSKQRIEIKNLPLKKLNYRYGSSCIVEDEINKLYIAFDGSVELRGEEGLLIIDIIENQIIDRLDLNGRPRVLLAIPETKKLFVTARGFDNSKKIAIVNLVNHKTVKSFDLDFLPVKGVFDGNHALLLNLLKEINVLDIHRLETIGTKPVEGIFDFAPVNNKHLLFLLLQRTGPPYYVDRLALYDIKTSQIIFEQQVSRAMHLQTFKDGRTFFTEIVDNTLLLNEVETE